MALSQKAISVCLLPPWVSFRGHVRKYWASQEPTFFTLELKHPCYLPHGQMTLNGSLGPTPWPGNPLSYAARPY